MASVILAINNVVLLMALVSQTRGQIGSSVMDRCAFITPHSSSRWTKNPFFANDVAAAAHEDQADRPSTDPVPNVCVITEYSNEEGNFAATATDMARMLSLPACSDVDSESSNSFTHALVIVPRRRDTVSSYAIAIQELNNKDAKRSRRRRRSTKKPKSQPFHVDFMPPSTSRLGKRFEGQSGADLLLKAVSPSGQVVYDLTAGFGLDSVLLARGGALRVHMVERDPVVWTLLQDGLRRLLLISSGEGAVDSERQRAVDLSSQLFLEETGDAVEISESILADACTERPDICYLDPMFPTRRKSAAVKKNMQILHGLLGSQVKEREQTMNQELALLEAAWNLATKRVVVKRPIHAASLGGASSPNGLKPSYSVKGTVNRWDVYVK